MNIMASVELEYCKNVAVPGEGRIALGADPTGLDAPCAYCLPALVTAHTVRDGKPCCRVCATTNAKPSMPSFLWRDA